MKTLSEKEQKMFDWDNELRFDSTDYSDRQVVEIAQKAIEFALENFKEQETVFEGCLYRYESKIENVALGIESHLQKNVAHKKSLLIKQFALDILNAEKYGCGRSGFIFLLYKLKMDNELKEIATNRKDFWETPRIKFQLLYALYRRRIKGFVKEAEQLIKDNPKEAELKKYSNKYIEQELKWK
jgi:hypothetical protein